MSDHNIFDLWDGKVRPKVVETNNVIDITIDPERATKYAASALRSEASEVAGTAEGGRNARLNKAAFNMGQHVGAGSIDAATVRSVLYDAGLACGLPAAEVESVLRDNENGGLTQGRSSPRHPAPLTPIPEVTVLTDVEPEDRSSIIRERFPILDWQELWNTEDEDEEWIVEPILPARRLVALFSAPKVGKSLLMLEMAVAISRGAPVLGVVPAREYRVLYVDFENDPRGDVRERLRAMNVTPNHLENLCYLSYPTLAKLDTWAGAAELMAIVEEYRCEVVVIDTISRAVQGEENENDTWLSFYRNTGLAMKQAGVACIRLDHTGKDHEKGMRGGSAKYGDVDAVWKLSKVTEETYRLDCTDHRMRIGETTIVVKRHMSPLRHDVQAEGRMAAFTAKVDEIVAALDAAGLPNDVGREGARGHLKSVGMSARNDALESAVKRRKMRVGYPVRSGLDD